MLRLWIALISWFAVIAQLVLMLQHATVPVNEAIIRFFSYFTILTNILVAVFFTRLWLRPNEGMDLTPLTVYIFVVGAIYQIILRPLWHPVGLQKLVDELLHSVQPVLVWIYWYSFQHRGPAYDRIGYWLLYPLGYLAYILVRGAFSGFYPYPFVDLTQHSAATILINCLAIAFLFVLLSALFIFIKKKQSLRNGS